MVTRLDERRRRFAAYYRYREGNLQGLQNVSATDVNGLTYIPSSEVVNTFNYFAAASRFYSDAMLSDMETNEVFYDALYRGIKDWTITGESVFILVDGRLISIQPQYFFPVATSVDDSQFERFLFIFPMVNEHGIETGKARVIDVGADGSATTSIRDYAGGVVGDAVSPQAINIGGMSWVRTDDGNYGEMEALVREINMRMSMIQAGMNANTFPLLQVDIDAVADGAFMAGDTQRSRIARRGLGLTVPPPFSGEEGARYVERVAPLIAESIEYLRLLLGQLSIVSGVPDYIYGVNLGQPASETERILFAGQAKIKRYRNVLVDGLARLGVGVSFPTEPFSTHKQRVETLLMLLDRGVINSIEVRRVIGLVN